ncbi:MULTISPECIES: DUF4176 domain-containing protein [Paenibacillus]|jgi:hypothetical protein|uniref:DUF4176 domain-containing protein n=1 Tax=Paenibacillus TaxID=44249 RepID=UPI000207200F|nr:MULTISPECIES: DUF4176 domain-containing protein [Paenibacillus]EGG35014.1 hypothetical protein HMPREF9412_5977 [Paenibacillus sp. HGF5]MCI1777499.1 DUF4176 domain-containing protein [Paenibacillus lautus]MCM3258654.1 DUF4176 domain-containing protein [Paenibacillus lautus]VTR30973.1 Uncharacterized protein conserved in bacteria [Actinobacillus pleuropneumoniae]
MEQHEQTEQKLLPIGSVVKFKDWDQTLMIYGRMQNDSKTLKRWDYVACFYPHGNLTADSNIFFNHKDISEIVFTGYVNEEEIAFRDALLEGIAKADQMAAAGSGSDHS